MNIGIPLNNASDKAAQKTTSDLYVNHSKQYGKSGNPPVGAAMGADSFTGLPNIESYNNYSKAGVFCNIAAVKQAAHTVPADVSETGSILDRFNLSDIPRWNWDLWPSPIAPPAWQQIPHRGMTTLSKSEIRELVRALADEFTSTTSERERQRISDQVRILSRWYASHGAPKNRKAQFEQAMRKTTRNAGGRTDFELSTPKKLMDYLFNSDGRGEENRMRNGMMAEREYPLPGGGTISGHPFGSDAGISFTANFPDQSFMRIHVFNDGGFGSVGTVDMGSERENQLIRELFEYWFRAIGSPEF